jgi:recombination protein RecR
MSAIDDLATELSRLPGIGRKTALRLTYHLIKQPAEQSRRLAAAVGAIVERVKPCSICANLTEGDPCSICADTRRDRSIICVVEEASDIGAIERSGEYRGLYHVLGGRLSPLDGVGPEDLTIDMLSNRTAAGDVREVIIATNPSLEGEATAIFIHRQLSSNGGASEGDKGTIVSRIARGIPVGGDLDYADGVTIAQALSARRSM